MSLSRWKMMAGVLGVSIGGLAAAASQCPKFDKSKGRQAETPVAFADTPKVPPAGAPSAPATTPPAVPLPPAVPPMPLPSVELPKPATAPTTALPAIPDFTPPAPAKPTDVTPATSALPPLPGIPEPGAKPPAPAKTPVADAPGSPKTPFPTADLLPPPTTPAPDGRDLFGTPKFTGPGGEPLPLNPPGKSVATPPVVGAGGTLPAVPPATGGTPPLPQPNVGAGGPQPILPIDPPGAIDVPPSKLTPPAIPDGGTTSMDVKAAKAATKFRILLRVGEGEPTFEVKCGDDLVMKVACEKVDIKSPEKGSGLSAVTAKGKVRFAGFGVEGTCDELSFMAGTGEVSMSGEVKVQVKDKLGRVESELSTATLKYKIDASAVGNSIKP